MDKTSLSLSALLITGTGLIIALVKFEHEGLYFSYAGENLFQIKGSIIEYYKILFFTILLTIGLVIEALTLISNLPERLHSIKFYICFFLFGILFMVFTFYLLRIGSNYYARKVWQPQVIQSYKPLYHSIKEILDNDEESIKTNYQTVEQRLNQIEGILDIKPKTKDFHKRVESLKKYFSNN